jgi:hypothetical protein
LSGIGPTRPKGNVILGFLVERTKGVGDPRTVYYLIFRTFRVRCVVVSGQCSDA